MGEVRRVLRRLRAIADPRLAGQAGQGLVEYALILAFVAVGVVGTLTAFGTGLQGQYGAVAATIGSL